MGGAYEVTGSTIRKYYSFAGMMVAMRDADGIKFLLTDHLGSMVAITNASGTLISEQRYLPFGQVREDVGTITATDFGYTGQRSLPEMGLMDYRARFYDPLLMRFIQPDSIVPSPANPQGFNRYSYVGNGPVNSSDPSGNTSIDQIKAMKKAYGKHFWGQYSKAWNRAGGHIVLPDFTPKPAVQKPPAAYKPFSTVSLYGTTTTPTTPSIACIVCLTSGSGTPSSIQSAISYLGYSPTGKSLFQYMMMEGFTIVYSEDCTGHGGNPVLVPGPACSSGSPTAIAGTMAHEAFHIITPGDSWLEEYQAFLVGDIVRNDIIQAGHGTSSDMRHSLSVYTVDINNPNKVKLDNDLYAWFQQYEPYYIKKGYFPTPIPVYP
jgi:RHS repeat-associated protein